MVVWCGGVVAWWRGGVVVWRWVVWWCGGVVVWWYGGAVCAVAYALQTVAGAGNDEGDKDADPTTAKAPLIMLATCIRQATMTMMVTALQTTILR